MLGYFATLQMARYMSPAVYSFTYYNRDICRPEISLFFSERACLGRPLELKRDQQEMSVPGKKINFF